MNSLKPQQAQNAVAWVTYFSMYLYLHELYSLSVDFQKQFKVVVVFYEALYGMKPGYLQNILIPTIFIKQ